MRPVGLRKTLPLRLQKAKSERRGDDGVASLGSVHGGENSEDVVAGDLAQVVVSARPVRQRREDAVQVVVARG